MRRHLWRRAPIRTDSSNGCVAPRVVSRSTLTHPMLPFCVLLSGSRRLDCSIACCLDNEAPSAGPEGSPTGRKSGTPKVSVGVLVDQVCVGLGAVLKRQPGLHDHLSRRICAGLHAVPEFVE